MKKSTDIAEKTGRLKFAFTIARRYLFSKKSHNAINIISGISSVGVAVGTMALVIVLSVFNGFEDLFSGLFSAFDPDLKISLQTGKYFSIDTPEFEELKSSPSVAVFTEVVEEHALLRHKEMQIPAMIKGVSEKEFQEMSSIDKLLLDGEFVLYDGAFERSVVGSGVVANLSMNAYSIDPLYIYAPKRTSRVNLLRPEQSFNQSATFISGVFAVQQADYDDEYVLVSLDLARELFEYEEDEVTAIELKLSKSAEEKKAQRTIQKLVGNDFVVKNRYEQQESYFNIMKIEKWITFLILSFILLIASFNIIGSLSMLIIDKADDIQTLRNLGADNQLIRKIFLFEGWMISVVGAFIGIILGVSLSLIQEKIGIIKLGSGFIIENYPSVTQFSDVILVFITVLIIGFFAAWYPVRYIKPEKNEQTIF